MVARNFGENLSNFFEGGCCYAALMRPNKIETRLQLHLGRWPCGC